MLTGQKPHRDSTGKIKRPVAFRPTLTDGLALSRIKIQLPPTGFKNPREAWYWHFQGTTSYHFFLKVLGYERQLIIVLEISMIHITQGKRKTNTGLIGRKNGWKIPIIGY
jgi:hypothetical protein